MKKIVIAAFFAVYLLLTGGQAVQANESYHARVTQILEQRLTTDLAMGEWLQRLELEITSRGERQQQLVIAENLDANRIYHPGDQLVIYQADEQTFLIADQVRLQPMLYLLLAFLAVVFLVSRWRGLGALLGLAFSFLIIIYFIVPRIAAGDNPIMVAILGSLLIIPATFYPSHGFNRKTTIAVISTVLALLITGMLANFFIDFAKLTGLSSEEAGFLQVLNPDVANLRGLLLAGIIIGVLGVLDDVTVSQASIVKQLKRANPEFNTKELYLRAMQVGHDHISSMVNTLILVYAGAALPLLLLFNDAARPFLEIINLEIIAEEIVRTLVGSIGLILAVPITTWLAAWFVDSADNEKSHAH